MKGRALVAKLLIVLLATTNVIAACPSVVQEVSDATKITAEEKQEVLEVAERFVRRMQETNDLTPLIGEIFVADYAERLHQEAINNSLFLMSKSVAEQASREELARYSLALNNCGYVGGLLLFRYKLAHAKEEDDNDGGDDEDSIAYFKKALPPDILELFKTNPILKGLFEDNTNEQTEEVAPDGQVEKSNADNGVQAQQSKADDDVQVKQFDADDDELIRNVEQLRSFTSTLELGAMLARKHLGQSSFKPTLLERHEGANDEENWAAERDRMKPRVWMLSKEFHGYPKDTRIFCANVLLYHMDLVRVDGKLKVLALYYNMD